MLFRDYGTAADAFGLFSRAEKASAAMNKKASDAQVEETKKERGEEREEDREKPLNRPFRKRNALADAAVRTFLHANAYDQAR
jgi:ATP-dependent protease HslVU (ClpYQ) peptidase subunit